MLIFCFILLAIVNFANAQTSNKNLQFDFYGAVVQLQVPSNFQSPFSASVSDEAIQEFYTTLNGSAYQLLVKDLLLVKEEQQLDDWLYYQLIRATAERISPKAENFYRYTLYKWFLLLKSGYASTLSLKEDKLLLYIQSDEAVYNMPCHLLDGKQYVCLNYHDYGSNIDFGKEQFKKLRVHLPADTRSFSYKIKSLPNFQPEQYEEKELQFTFYQTAHQFKIKLNSQVNKIFSNYPVVDYESFFNIPMSNATYASLIPLLKQNIKLKSQQAGVDYLMRFTRDAFLFAEDSKNFGGEKRLSPEQTLLFQSSDCEDRAALFFYLVKEIYNLPMIALSFPKHITIAVGFDKPIKNAIQYKGHSYSVCEPTPQKREVKMGRLTPSLRNQPFSVVYHYLPKTK